MIMTSLVIFDCDGVLVDSEMLSAGVLKSMLAEEGMAITDEIFRQDFLGRSFATAAVRAEVRFGKALHDDFQLRYRERLLAQMEVDLRPMAGVFDMLENLRVPFCLATSSSPPRLQSSLRISGLGRFFEGRAFTTAEVEHGKPAPDVFIYAAKQMSCEARDAIVIEDSEMGVRAGLAAGAKVWHFQGGAHIRNGYRLPHDLNVDASIADMVALNLAFQEIGLCGPSNRD